MTPHSIREDMMDLLTRMGHRAHEHFSLRDWADADVRLKEAVHFDMGTCFATRAHIEFADGMLDRDLFRLPFPVCLFTGEMSPQAGILAIEIVDAAGRLQSLRWYTVAPTIAADGRRWMVPLAINDLLPEDEETRTPAPLAAGRVQWRSLTTTEHRSRTTGELWDFDRHAAAAEKGLRLVLGSVALMMSKDVDVRSEPASEKLNRKRAAKARPLIGERRIVTIRPERRPGFVNARAEYGEARASPRMHWRRGHFRDLGEGRVIPVAPAIVNGNPDAMPAPKAYRMGEPARENPGAEVGATD